MSGEVGGGWPGPGHRGFTRRGRGRSGWEQWAEALPGPWLWPRPGMGVGIPQHQAWRPAGIQTDGRKGALCLGLVIPEHLTPFPGPSSRDGHPGEEAWMGPGSGGKGAPHVPRFSVFGAAQRKMFSRWEAPLHGSREPQGADLPAPSQSPRPFWTTGGLAPLLATQRQRLLAVPHFGRGWGMKVQTMVPLWAGRHQGGAVAPGCKALAEEAWGRRGHTSFLRPQAPCPSRAGCWEEAQLCPLGLLEAEVPSL